MIVKAPSQMFKPAPEGSYGAVCVDVVDIGEVTNEWGTKHCCEVVWEIDELDAETIPIDRFKVKKRYTASLSEKANLFRDLTAWRGRKFTPEELAGFDLEQIIGKPCMIQVVHHLGSKGGVFANVNSVSALPKGMKAIEMSGHYLRRSKQEHSEGGDDGGAPF